MSFWATNGVGAATALPDTTGMRRSWDAIVPGFFNVDGLTDLLFYER